MNLKENNRAVQAVRRPACLNTMIDDVEIRERFDKMLGKKTAGFLSSLLSVVNNNKLLKEADPRSVLSAAATAASLDLPVNPSLGKAYIVPYRNKQGIQIAQFQIGYKGLIELAQRSGQMKSIVMTPVYEGEISQWDRFTETYVPGEQRSEKIVAYYARFELCNGFSKATYWTKDEVIRHAMRFNKSCQRAGKLADIWASDFDAMACKTVLASIIKTYAPLSIEMQSAFVSDGAVFGRDGGTETEVIQGEPEQADDITAEAVPVPEETEPAENRPEQAGEGQPMESGTAANGSDFF